MEIKPKYYNKFYKTLYKSFNIVLIASFVILGIAFTVLLGLNRTEQEARIIGILILGIFVTFALLNLTIVFIEFYFRSKLGSILQVYINEKRYDDAIEFLQTFCKKHKPYNINQSVLYYAGYINLLKDNVDDALFYLTQFEIEKQKVANVYYLANTISILYIIYAYKCDEKSLRDIVSVINAKCNYILKATRFNVDISEMLNAIKSFEENDFSACSIHLSKCRINKLPIVKRLIEKRK